VIVNKVETSVVTEMIESYIKITNNKLSKVCNDNYGSL